MKTPPCFEDAETKRMIQKLCDEQRIDVTLLKDLCEVIQQHSGSARKEGVDADIAGCLDRFLVRNPTL